MLPEKVLKTTSEVLDPVSSANYLNIFCYQSTAYPVENMLLDLRCSQVYKISSFKKQIRSNLVFLPNGVSTKIALKSSVGFEAMLTASICSKLPSGWHLGTSSAMGR